MFPVKHSVEERHSARFGKDAAGDLRPVRSILSPDHMNDHGKYRIHPQSSSRRKSMLARVDDPLIDPVAPESAYLKRTAWVEA